MPKAPHCPHISGRIVFLLQNTKLTSTKADENGHMTFRQKLRSRACARVRYTQPGNARPTREYFNTYGAQKHKAILSILTGHKHRAILQYYCQYLRGNPSILNTNTYGGANQYFAGSLVVGHPEPEEADAQCQHVRACGLAVARPSELVFIAQWHFPLTGGCD